MGVNISGRAEIRVAEPFLDLLQRHAVSQQQAGAAIAAVLSRSSMTVKRSLNELETAGLIMRVRQGVGEPNRIYVLIPGKEDAALA